MKYTWLKIKEVMLTDYNLELKLEDNSIVRIDIDAIDGYSEEPNLKKKGKID